VSDQVAAPVIVLVHSSSVGPSTWAAVARELRSRGEGVEVPSMLGFADEGPPYAGAYLDRVAAALASLPLDGPVLLVGHSNAGLFLPAIALSLIPRGVAMVFADASIPPLDFPAAELAPAAFLDELRPMAVDGVLPRWSDWWPDEVTAGLYPDPSMRRLVASEEPQLPLSFYEERVFVPAGWARHPCGYLRLSDGYESEAVTATGLGWPVRRLAGEHLHMLVDPAGVAGALRDLASALTPATGRQEA
jgi:Alpha/beta hydrolase family